MDETPPENDVTPTADDRTSTADNATAPPDDVTRGPESVPPAERHSARAALYSGVAAAFCYPDESTVDDLTHEDTAEGLRSAAAKLGYDSAVESLLSAIDATDRDDFESAYNDLFGLPSDDGTYPVVPYEAEYTIGDEVGRQQRRIATVVGLLDAFGVQPADEFHERQDHLVVELELMQVLAARRAVAERDGDDETAANLERAESVLLSEHLAGFVPAFAHEVRESTDECATGATGGTGATDATAVYRAAADLAAELVSDDAADHPELDVDFETAPEVRTRG